MMKSKRQIVKSLMGAALVTGALTVPSKGGTQTVKPASILTGTWTLVAADLLLPDGRRTHDYGDAPKGLLIIDAEGHYSLQIYDTTRPKFASGQKAKGLPAEYEAAIMGSSVHFGTISVDSTAHIITLNIEQSTYPNQEGTSQKRNYKLEGDILTYRVPPRPDGAIPVSVWRRA